MADIITRLKVDAKQHNSELDKAKQSIQQYVGKANSMDGIVKNLIGSFGKYATAVGMGATALKGLQKAIESNENAHDKLARAVYGAQSAADAFFNSISTGNVNAFTNGLQDVIDKAVEAYNAIDSLGSYMVRFNPNAQALNSQISTLQAEARALKAKGDIEGANAKLEEARRISNQLAKNTLQAGELQTKAGFKDLQSLMKNAHANPVSDAKLAWYADPKNWDEVNRKAAKYLDLKKQIEDYDKAANAPRKANETEEGYSFRLGSLASKKRRAEKALNADPSLYNAYIFNNLRDDTETDAGKRFNAALNNIYGNQNAEAQVAALKARINRQDAMTNRSTGPKSTSASATSNEAWSFLSADVKGLKSSELMITEESIKHRIELEQAALEKKDAFDVVGRKLGQAVIDGLKKQLASIKENNPIAQVVDDFKASIPKDLSIPNLAVPAKETQQAWQGAASAMSSVGSALSSIEDPGLKVAGILAQAVANVALGFSNAAASPANAAGGVWTWIPAVATGLATMITTISQIKSVGKYADGGVVGGSSYAGDQLYAKVNSGETILNRVQAQNALDMMQPATIASGGNSTISGEQIVTVVRNYGKRIGHSEWLK